MNEPLPEILVGKWLRARGWRLAVAESCTGGLIGHRLTNVPGSSTYYQGSITAYAYEAKVRLLGVRWETLEAHGAVSEAVVLEMARGVRTALAADVGLSVSGIAGPGGGTPEKPVGTTWIGLSTPVGDHAVMTIGQGDRLANKQHSAEEALQLLVRSLQSEVPPSIAPIPGDLPGQPVDVTARFDPDGHITPIFLHRGAQRLPLTVGRGWSNERGEHVLVQLPDGETLHLTFLRSSGRWVQVPRPNTTRPA
ncbi:MAG: hypothetical protein Fur0018_19010 [Anaerolineales bacterium]